MTGIEPARNAWKALMLPLHHTRIVILPAGHDSCQAGEKLEKRCPAFSALYFGRVPPPGIEPERSGLQPEALPTEL